MPRLFGCGDQTVSLTPVPRSAELLTCLERVAADAPLQELAALVGELERIKTVALARFYVGSSDGQPEAQQGDRLLGVQEAARKLGLSKDYLYRHAKALPFTRRLGPRQLRFSEQGIEKYIRQRQGR